MARGEEWLLGKASGGRAPGGSLGKDARGRLGTRLCYKGRRFVREGGPRPSARVGGNYGQAGGMAFWENFGRSGSGGKLGEGRAGTPGDQALLQRTALCKRGRELAASARRW